LDPLGRVRFHIIAALAVGALDHERVILRQGVPGELQLQTLGVPRERELPVPRDFALAGIDDGAQGGMEFLGIHHDLLLGFPHLPPEILLILLQRPQAT
jgi:hypothetical protein